MLRIVATLTALFLAIPAMAQNVTADPKVIAKILVQKGYTAEIDTDDGNPTIIGEANDMDFTIFFLTCTSGRNCKTIQFYTYQHGEKIAQANELNAWNETTRFTKAYQDEGGDAVLEMDLDLDAGGISRALFIANLDTWVSQMADFQKKFAK